MDKKTTNGNQKAFIFLYPETDIINFEIDRGANGCSSFLNKEKKDEFLTRLKATKSRYEKDKIREEAIQEINAEFRIAYKDALNQCIDLRYRQNRFTIYYAIFNGSEVSDVMNVQPCDRVIHVGIDAKTHRTPRADGTFVYPNQNFILGQMSGINILRVGGFHLWDCVQKLARRAYKHGIDTLVDEDLTDMFAYHLQQPNFKFDRFPDYNPRQNGEEMYQLFMRPRRGKPWMWQKY